MDIKNFEQLVEFFNKIDLEKSTFVFKEEKTDCGCGGSEGKCACDNEVVETKVEIEKPVFSPVVNSLIVESFADSPEFDTEVVEEGDNVFYVNDFEAIPDACGTGQITLPDRVSNMNMCEMDGKAKVNLDIVVEGKQYHDVPFVLQKTEENPRLVISKTQLV